MLYQLLGWPRFCHCCRGEMGPVTHWFELRGALPGPPIPMPTSSIRFADTIPWPRQLSDDFGFASISGDVQRPTLIAALLHLWLCYTSHAELGTLGWTMTNPKVVSVGMRSADDVMPIAMCNVKEQRCRKFKPSSIPGPYADKKEIYQHARTAV